MATESTVSNYFCSTFADGINVFDCRLSGVIYEYDYKKGSDKWVGSRKGVKTIIG